MFWSVSFILQYVQPSNTPLKQKLGVDCKCWEKMFISYGNFRIVLIFCNSFVHSILLLQNVHFKNAHAREETATLCFWKKLMHLDIYRSKMLLWRNVGVSSPLVYSFQMKNLSDNSRANIVTWKIMLSLYISLIKNITLKKRVKWHRFNSIKHFKQTVKR